MIPGLTSIIIPAYNAEATLLDAIGSALAQTSPVEVIVVDDGSTDGTLDRVMPLVAGEYFDPRVRLSPLDHRGVSAARNHGINHAAGEFVMFLDADDIIDADKVERQRAAMSHGIGWVLCDVSIREPDGRLELASKRYDYAARMRTCWLGPALGAGNFIPVHSPLVRRDVLGNALRFSGYKLPEDWHFWYAVADIARARYIPDVLATYRKRRGGRNASATRAARSWPGAVSPLRLNLGCGQQGKDSWHPLAGFVNLDASLGWRFETGMREFADGSVAGITISHALMFVPLAAWPALFRELARVLRSGGVIRITEDDTRHPDSRTYPNGWRGSEPAVTLTNAGLVASALSACGLTWSPQAPDTTAYVDGSLCQSWHGNPPDVFYIEGIKA